MHEHAQQAAVIRLPDTAQGCRDRLAVLQDEITSIRIQIATTDIRRQVEKKSLDPTWYHRAKTALRHLQRERAGLVQQSRPRRESVKDCLIAMLRERHDETTWSTLLTEARRRAGEAA